MTRDILKRFKALTGYGQSDIAKRINASRQHVSHEISATSLTHKSAVGLWLCILLDDKIEYLEKNIHDMKELKKEIYRSSIAKGGVDGGN